MNTFVTKPIKIPLGQTENYVNYVSSCVKLPVGEIRNLHLAKRSVDARDKGNVHFVCTFLFECKRSFVKNAQSYVAPVDVLAKATWSASLSGKNVVVVGAGPAGLFCALYLSKRGVKVTVVERGSNLPKRTQTVQSFFDGGQFDPNCNVQFGLGGAGTFSDGKLTTGISSPLTYTVFSQFVRNGAPDDIMYNALPHIGTDKLATAVASLRDEIVACGGRFLFDTQLADLVVGTNGVSAVVVDDGKATSTLPCDCVCLATGHSARDVFEMLQTNGADLAFKAFAVGLRVEHSRQYINQAQYGLAATHRDLTAASYKLVHNGQDHSCYTFCMCPGGMVVAANSEPNTVVVNGMSNYARDLPNSNSALVVTVNASDVERFGFGNGVTAGVAFQRDLERKAYALGGVNYVAPCQNVVDFVANKPSTQFDVAPSYPRGVKGVNLRQLLPQEIGDSIAQALQVFDKKIHGFGSSGVLTGVETRTSSPVRILRDETFQSNLLNLYPVGEGAGYAGGIVSSAVDGLRVADAICKRFE